MSTHHGGNDGNNLPPDGDQTPDPEFPELPAEWGDVTIPDDPSELAAEAELIRQELAREQLEDRPVHEPIESPAGDRPASAGGGEPSIGVPLLIMSVAVMITLVSLFAMAWSGSGSVAPSQPGQAGEPTELPPITLLDSTGTQVALTAQAPLVIMLVEDCACDGLMSATLGAVPSGVTVAAIGHQAPAPPALEPGDPQPLLLADPSGRVRTELGLDPPTGDASVVLVDQDLQITAAHPVVTSFAQIQGDLTDLSS